MKKHIYTGIFLFLMGIGSIHAQDTQLFRFVSQATQNSTRLVLHHNLNDNSVEAIPLKNQVFNSKDGYLQAFILQPVPNQKGEVLIASAKAPEYFLKRNGSNVIFEKINNQSLDTFRWSISFHSKENFNGESLDNINIVTPQTVNNSAVLIASDNDNVFINSVLPSVNTTGGIIEIIDPFVFTMQKITNVF
ncbi:hypothetical protein [Aquimarina rhabdastrellae]